MFLPAFLKRLLIAWILLIAVKAVTASDLQGVLDKHLKALGGREAIAAVKSVKAFSTIEYMGIAGKAVGITKFPGQYYTRLELGQIVETKGYDGLTAWTIDPNGITRKDISEELKPMINELYLAGYSYLLSGRIAGIVEQRGDSLIENENYHHLAMYPVGGDSISVFINATTGRLEYRSEIITGIKMISSYSDFRKVSGIEIPFASQMETPDAPYEIAAWTDSIQVNIDIPDSLFLMPGISSVDVRFPEEESVVIPAKIEDNQILVKAKINGRGPFVFLLDSGSATTVISSKLAGELGIRISGNIPARGVGGYGQMGLGVIDSISLGPVSWPLSRITIFDFSSLFGRRASLLKGILGYDFFARFPMLIDFEKSTLTLFNPDRAKLAFRAETFDFDIYLQTPVVEALLDGAPVRLALDLGSTMGIVVQGHSRWYKKMSQHLKETGQKIEIEGVGGAQPATMVRANSFRLDRLLMKEPVVIFVEEFDAIPFPDYIEGFLGIDILKRYNLFINYPERKVGFRERTN